MTLTLGKSATATRGGALSLEWRADGSVWAMWGEGERGGSVSPGCAGAVGPGEPGAVVGVRGLTERWNDGMMEWLFVPSFHHSIIPSFLASPAKHRLPFIDLVRHEQLPPAIHALLAAPA